jgi:hypothetical protein
MGSESIAEITRPVIWICACKEQVQQIKAIKKKFNLKIGVICVLLAQI